MGGATPSAEAQRAKAEAIPIKRGLRRQWVSRRAQPIEVICPAGGLRKFLSTPSAKNISLRRLLKSALLIPPSRLEQRGASRSSRTLVRDAMDAAATQDERRCGGRRSRVVLMPRRWHQVGDDASHHAGDGGKKARSPGRARRKPLKPLRREGRMIPPTPVVLPVCFLPLHTGRGCELSTRPSLRPLVLMGG